MRRRGGFDYFVLNMTICGEQWTVEYADRAITNPGKVNVSGSDQIVPDIQLPPDIILPCAITVQLPHASCGQLV